MANTAFTVTVEAMGVGCAAGIDCQPARVFATGAVRVLAIVRQKAMAALTLASLLTVETAADRARPTSSETLHVGCLLELGSSAKWVSSLYPLPETKRTNVLANAD
jgi:hypothetical protein